MSSVPESPQPEAPVNWPVLAVHERRVLGVLVEKAKTTPDAYPLSINALITGSNQKSNRDPVLDLSDVEVEEALASCQKRSYVIRITGGGRVERWRHNLYDIWHVNKVELAVLGELLLRGAQTEGELRGRASRMEPIADLDTLRGVLRKLAERKLVVYLTPEGRRGTMVTHGFHSPKELDRLRATHPADRDDEDRPAAAAAVPTEVRSEPSDASQLKTQVAALEAEVAAMRGQFAQLQTTVATLETQLRSLKDALGA